MRRRVTIPVVRALVMLGLGSGGMAKQLFLVPKPDLVQVWVCIGLMLGPAVLEAWWRARNPEASGVPDEPSRGSASL